MRIAHISDLHFTSFFKDNNLKSIRYLLKYALKQNADHIVITGDLTDNSNREDFLTLRKLFEELNLLHHDRLSLVIGNHDIFGGVQTAEDIFSFPERCKNVDYKMKVKEFMIYFKETFDGAAFIDNETVFPYAKILNDVLLVGMNTNDEYSTAKNTFASNGAVHLEQFNKAIQILNKFSNSVNTKIIMLHHHFNKMKVTQNSTFGGFWQNVEKQTMKLRKKKRLFTAFKEYGIDLVMHGHYHETGEYERKGVRFLNAGGSVKSDKAGQLSINFADIKKASIKIKSDFLKPSNADLLFDFAERQNELLRDEELFISEMTNN